MADRSSKAVLTIIAAALVWLCLWSPGPVRLGTPARAEEGMTRIGIAAVGGHPLTTFRGVAAPKLPVEVEGTR